VIDAIKDQVRGLPSGFRVTTPLVISAVAIGVSAYVVAGGVGGLFGAVITRSIDKDSADPLLALVKESDDFITKSQKRFDGRSPYVLPPAPMRKPVVAEKPKPVEPPKDPGPPPPPAVYSGPSPTSVFGNIVNFGMLRVKLGETTDGIKVTAIDSPYSITVEHMRGTYTVPLFARYDDRLLKPTRTPGMTTGNKASTDGNLGADGTPSGAGDANGAAGAAAGLGVMGGAPGQPGGMPGAGRPVGSGTGTGAGSPVPGGPDAVGSPAVPGTVSGPGGPTAGANGPSRAGGVGPRPNPTIPTPSAPTPGGAPPSAPGETPAGSEVPSPAMEPQQVPPPPSEPSSSEAGTEYVDRSHLPPPRSPEQIGAMTISQAQAALAAIDATANWSVDDHSRARLNYERGLLLQRINGKP
jgi:hypothetical protein